MIKDKEKIEKITKRIKDLLYKTTSNGCSEHEAVSAAKKAQELLDKYDLTLSQIGYVNETYKELRIFTKSKKRSDVHFLLVHIGNITTTKAYFSRHKNIGLVYTFFGEEKNVLVAEYLYRVIENAFKTEIKKFKKSEYYIFSNLSGKTKIASFKIGMTDRLVIKLEEIEKEREKYEPTQALVLYNKIETLNQKASEIIGDDFVTEKPIVKLKSEKSYTFGYKAGENVELNKAIK